MKIEMTEDSGRLDKMIKAVKVLKGTVVEVGLPESAGGHLQFILAVQEHGSPVMHIPPRPVVRPGLNREETKSAMREAIGEALESAIQGDEAGILAGFEAAGQAGADGIRAYIDEGISPANAPITVHGGWLYNRVGKKGVKVSGKGFNKPLYDTGTLYRAFSYEVKAKG